MNVLEKDSRIHFPLFRIQNYFSPRLFALTSLMSPVCPIILPVASWREVRFISYPKT